MEPENVRKDCCGQKWELRKVARAGRCGGKDVADLMGGPISNLIVERSNVCLGLGTARIHEFSG